MVEISQNLNLFLTMFCSVGRKKFDETPYHFQTSQKMMWWNLLPLAIFLNQKTVFFACLFLILGRKI